MDLIDREALLIQIEISPQNAFIRNTPLAMDLRKLYSNVIKLAPTVEAEPVRHGKWVYIFEPDENDNVQCNCSVCGAGDLHAKDTVVPYCWKCGAKMDGENDD